VRAYLLDPARLQPPSGGLAKPQDLAMDSEPVDGDPFKGLIRIDEISAQRGFGFSPSAYDDETAHDPSEQRLRRRLSTQLRAYYTHHLDPLSKPEPKDLIALEALFNAQLEFGSRMEDCFADALTELEDIGYPGITDPKLTIAPKLNLVDGLNHPSAVQFQVPTHLESGSHNHSLPEDSNGLGYQNLISIVFALMSFRDKWVKVGKAGVTLAADDVVPPLHLVLIEEYV
jgi:predicted ATP-dependent endonuclease of OLD family